MELICKDEGAAVVKTKPKQNVTDRSDMIAKGILDGLGRPKNLHKVEACNVYGTRWRVNVWCEVRPDVNLIKHSYFVVATDGGEILTANPPIQRLY